MSSMARASLPHSEQPATAIPSPQQLYSGLAKYEAKMEQCEYMRNRLGTGRACPAWHEQAYHTVSSLPQQYPARNSCTPVWPNVRQKWSNVSTCGTGWVLGAHVQHGTSKLTTQ